MKNIFNIKTLFFVALTSLVLTSCSDDDYQKEVVDNTVNLSAGTADFSTYVSVGNSLTAGFTDGALFKAGQENSIPNLVANKFAMAGGGDFTQPLMNDNVGGLLIGGTMIQNPRLFFNGAGPAPLNAMPTTEIIGSTPGPYNNMGVPGAKVAHLLYDGYGNLGNLATHTANPYFVRMASSSNATILGDAVSQSPTFFSLWIGANDVLKYALAGGESDETAPNYSPITPSDGAIGIGFNASYEAILNSLVATGAKGVVLNLPNITVIPYFTTIPYNPVPLDDADKVALLNGAFAQYNGGVQQVLAGYVAANVITQEMADAELAKRTINFVVGQNPVTIVDETLMDLSAYNIPNYRMATADDLIVLTAKSFIGTEVGGNPQLINGVSVPLADKWVLIPSEQEAVQTATEAYNTTIEALATANDLAFVDVKSMMNQLADGGIVFDEFTMTNQYVFGNTFSLDGVHPTARGNAFISNEILKAIDAKYGSTFEASGNLNKATDFVTQYPATLQ